MKRDFEVFRKLLIGLEEKDNFQFPLRPKIAGVSDEEVAYHIKLLSDAGLVDASDWSTDDESDWVVTSMTAAGHDYLDSMRNETVWNRAKDFVRKNGGVLTLQTTSWALQEVLRLRILGG
jgi:DNA-binding transcriptional ArsR family regulator